ncbi:MAG: hypothetical protein AB7N65_06070 [Vicinamibacterales bacterium]
MAAVVEAVRGECAELGERMSDVWRRAKQVSDDAGALKHAAREVIDDGVRAASAAITAVRRSARDLECAPADVAYHVRRAPFRAIGAALGTGLVIGLALAWWASRVRRTAEPPRSVQARTEG